MIQVICYRGLGHREMSPVEDSLITSESMAIVRGKWEIDKQWYLQHIQSFEVPHRKTDSEESLKDGDLIYMADSRFGIFGNRLVRKITISGDNTQVKNTIETVKFQEFE